MDDNSKTSLYTDVVEAGSLTNFLEAIINELGFDMQMHRYDVEILAQGYKQPRWYASIKKNKRSCSISMAEYERSFSCTFWSNGVSMAYVSLVYPPFLCQCANEWLVKGVSTQGFKAYYDFIEVSEDAIYFEQGIEVEYKWSKYLNEIENRFPKLTDFVKAAACHPQLRALFPFTSMYRFSFSRCTGYPYSWDLPMVYPANEGGYKVITVDDELIGQGDAQEAVKLVVQNLPSNCGPALPGTADDLDDG